MESRFDMRINYKFHMFFFKREIFRNTYSLKRILIKSKTGFTKYKLKITYCLSFIVSIQSNENLPEINFYLKKAKDSRRVPLTN
jgi:hypothetical protein